MDPIDEKNRKPRRTRGTPSFQYRNRFAYAVIAAGTVLFALFTFTPIYRESFPRISERLHEVTEEQKARRAMFAFPAARSRKDIQETLDERDKLFSDR